MQAILVITTFPTKDEAMKVANLLVEKRLVACAQIQPEMTSIYRWQGAIEQSKEVAVYLKTIETLWPKIEAEIKEHHSYDVPEIIAIPLAQISSEYNAWLNEQLA
mgnify:CR=1 FL=1